MNVLSPFHTHKALDRKAGEGKDIGQGSVDTGFSIVQVLHNPPPKWFALQSALCISLLVNRLFERAEGLRRKRGGKEQPWLQWTDLGNLRGFNGQLAAVLP